MRRLSESEKVEIWDRFVAGESLRSISRQLGRPPSTIRTHVVSAKFRRPLPAVEWSPKRLSLMEREEISRGLAAEESLRCIARRLGRAASTRCRVRWLPTVGGCGIGRRRRTKRRGIELSVRNQPSWRRIIGSAPLSRTSWSGGGPLFRSRGGSSRHTLTTRRCG